MATGRSAIELPAELGTVDEPATTTRPARTRLVFLTIPSGTVPTSRVINGTSPIRVNAGASATLAADITLTILPASGSIAGSMSSAHFTLVNEATATATADKIAKYGSSGELTGAFVSGASFRQTGGTPATVGVLRCISNSIPISAKDSGGNNASLLSWSSSDILALGDASRTAALQFIGKAGSSCTTTLGGVDCLVVTGSGVALCGTPQFGSGTGVVSITDASVEPTTSPSGASLLWSSSTGSLKVKSPNGVVTTLGLLGNQVKTTQISDRLRETTQTTNATPAVLGQVTIPSDGVARVHYKIMARDGDNNCSWHERVVRTENDGGGAVLTQTVTPFADKNDIGASSIAIINSGDRVAAELTGIAATTIDWTVSAEIEITVA